MPGLPSTAPAGGGPTVPQQSTLRGPSHVSVRTRRPDPLLHNRVARAGHIVVEAHAVAVREAVGGFERLLEAAA